jgi:sodium-dependent dicarboxylate transporter 2/3/5
LSTHSIDLGDDAIERLSPMEERFERIRKGAGFILAPIVFLAIWFAPLEGLRKPSWEDKSKPRNGAAYFAAPMAVTAIPVHNDQAHRLAAIMATTAVLWVCESLPMTVTALLAAAACVMTGVGKPEEVFAPFASYIMFLFIGSFILARAVFIHGLDRRFAYGILANPLVGGRPERILFGFGLATAFMSAWISNTATTAMMFAIGMSILSVFFREGGPDGKKINPRFATGLMLMTSFAASIGGLCTPIGTPPNMIGIEKIRSLNVEISFFQWSLLGFPLVAVLFLILYVYLNFFCKAGVAEIQGGAKFLHERRQALGAWTTSQKSTMFAFGLTVTLWILPGLVFLVYGESSEYYKAMKNPFNEGVVAILGACLLFLLPGDRDGRAINWNEASQIDWGIVLLYGGGFALGALMERTGLAAAIGRSMTTWLPLEGEFAMLVFATTIAVIVSEATSNTASAQIIVPVVIAVAQQAGVNPIVPALGATFGASLGFMLPVSTPCNAIVYGSGYIPLTRMIRYGLLLDLAGIVVVVGMMRYYLPIIGIPK